MPPRLMTSSFTACRPPSAAINPPPPISAVHPDCVNYHGPTYYNQPDSTAPPEAVHAAHDNCARRAQYPFDGMDRMVPDQLKRPSEVRRYLTCVTPHLGYHTN